MSRGRAAVHDTGVKTGLTRVCWNGILLQKVETRLARFWYSQV